ncbi:MAG: CHAT domain-containing protein [Saprospiraceae bacterium]
MKPIIILAFSNSQDTYLDSIKLEREGTSKALDDLNDANIIGVRKIAHLSNEQLFYYLNRYRHQVRIFHYAGHASGSTLQLESNGGDELAYSEGIAGILGQSNSLELVFLNGCATYGQVETLLNKGVKAVIATSVAINDTKAYQFSIKFYETLAAGETIGDAFEAAKSFLIQLGNGPKIERKGLKLKRKHLA